MSSFAWAVTGICIVVLAIIRLLSYVYDKLSLTTRPNGEQTMTFESRRIGRPTSVSASSVDRGMISAMGSGMARLASAPERVTRLDDGSVVRTRSSRSAKLGNATQL